VRGTALLVAALIAVGIAATVDALRSDDDVGRERVRSAVTTSPAAELRRADVTGMLYFAVRSANRCEVRGLRLPDLSDAVAFTSEFCRFDVNSAGAVVGGPSCPGGGVVVQEIDESPRGYPGCAPAWRPNGDLTFVLDGDVVNEEKVLIEDVARFAQDALGSGSRLAVQQVAWLTEERVAVVVTRRAVVPAVLVVVEDGKAVSEPIFAESDANIEVSADREEFFVGGDGFGVQVFNRRGAFVSGSRFNFVDVAAVAESRDGRFVALARPGNLCIYEQTDPPPRERFPVSCLPFDAVDLAWR
jgi:hypothetical protein